MDTPLDFAKVKKALLSRIPPSELLKVEEYQRLYDSGQDTYGEGHFSAERLALHATIVDKFMMHSQTALPVGGPKAIFFAGLPASGKTTYLHHAFRAVDGTDGLVFSELGGEPYLVLDIDNIKRMIPEYDQGRGSQFIHRESAYLNRKIADKMEELKVNIIIDGTFSKKDRFEHLVKSLLEHGYSLSMVVIEAEMADCMERAVRRFLDGGRFVPLDLMPHLYDGMTANMSCMGQYMKVITRVKNTGSLLEYIVQITRV